MMMQLTTNEPNPSVIRRQIVIAVSSDFLSGLASGVFSFAIGLHVLKSMNSILAFGSLQMIGPIVGFLGSSVIGTLVDHGHHQKIILKAQTVNFISFLLYGGLIALYPSWLYPGTIILASITSLVGRVSGTAYQASVISLVPSEQVQKLSGLEQAASSLSGILAPVLGGLLYALVPFESFVGVGLLESMVVFGAALLLNFQAFTQPALSQAKVLPSEPANHKILTYSQFIRQAVRHYPVVLYLIIVAPCMNFFFSGLGTMYSVLMIKQFHRTSTDLGIVEAALSLGLLVGGLIVSHQANFKTPIKLANMLMILLGVPLFLIGLLTPQLSALAQLGLVVGANSATGLMLVFINVPVSSFLSRSIPQREQGRLFSLIGGLSQVLSPFGILLITGLLTLTRSSTLFVGVGGVITILASSLWWLLGRRVNHQVTQQLAQLEMVTSKGEPVN